MIRSDHDSMGDCCGEKPLPASRSGQSDSSRSNPWLRYPELSKVDSEDRTESESDDGTTDYETSRPFKKCTMKSRNGLNNHNESEYNIKDFPRGGDVVIGKTRGKDAWATTRRIKITSPWTKEKQCMSIFQH